MMIFRVAGRSFSGAGWSRRVGFRIFAGERKLFFSILVGGWLWELAQDLHDLPHRRALHAVLLGAQQGDVEDVHYLVHRNGRQPRVQDLHHLLLVWARHHLDPLDNVDAVAKLPYRLPPGDELQKHHTEAVDIALLIDLEGVCIFWKATDDRVMRD